MGAAMIGMMVVLMAGGLFGLNMHGGGGGHKHDDAQKHEMQKQEEKAPSHSGDIMHESGKEGSMKDIDSEKEDPAGR